jgi:DNA-binding response OmpR family regulator
MNSATKSGSTLRAREIEGAVGVAETAHSATTVLVIEDEPSVSAFLRSALQRRGYQVVTAPSASEGLDLLKRGCYLGVISDVRTPGAASGTEVYTWIRESAPELLTRLVFITGDIVNEQTSKLLAESGAPVVVKPFRVSELISAVEQTIGKPSKEQNG